MPVRVTDIYRGDNVTSFATAKANGLIGVIHKATTGRTGKDPMYKGRRTAAQAAGLQCVLSLRPGNHPQEPSHSYKIIHSFAELIS